MIEVKKSNGVGASRDIEKLSEFTTPKPEAKYGYKLGLFLEFNVGEQKRLTRAECFENGTKTENCCCCNRLLDIFGSQP